MSKTSKKSTLVITCVHGRPEVWKKWLDWNIPIFKKNNCHVLVGGSTEDINCFGNPYLPDLVSWFYVLNQPVGAKFNRTFLEGRYIHARRILNFILYQTFYYDEISSNPDPRSDGDYPGFDQVLLLGSDDLISPNYLEYFEDKEFDVAGVTDFYVHDYQSNRGTRYHNTRKLKARPDDIRLVGAGRIMKTSFLDKIDWKIFHDTKNHSLDMDLDQKIRDTGAQVLEVCGRKENIWMVDLKTSESLNGFEYFEHLGAVDLPCLLKKELANQKK
jgi:hypothetical protein